MKKLLLVLFSLVIIGGSIWGGVVLADDLWSDDYDEISGSTLDINPSGMSIVDRTCSSLQIQLVKSLESQMTEVRYSPTASPTTRTAGYQAYYGPETSFWFSPIYPVGITGGQIYYLSAWGWSDTLGWSATGTYTSGYTLPCDPTNLVATAISDTRVDLTWTKGIGGDKTELYYRKDVCPTSRSDAAATLVPFASPTDNSVTVTSLTAGATYYFTAWAYDTDSTLYSAGYDWTASGTAGPPSVTTLEATKVTPVTATLNGFVDSAGGLGTCWVRFQYGVGGVDNVSTAWVSGKATGTKCSVSITGLTIATTYQFRVQAYNLITGAGSPVSGSTLTFTTCSSVGDPSYLYADPTSPTEIGLSWVLGSCSDRSIVRYSETAYPSTENAGLSAYYGEESVYSLGSLKGGTTYYFRVWATESTGTYISDNYSEAVCTTPAGSGTGTPYTKGDTGNWFLDPDCSKITGLPFYSGVQSAAAGIGWDVCVMFVFLIFVLSIAAGLVTALASKGNLAIVLVVMGLVLLIGVAAGPLPKVWFVIYVVFSVPIGYLLPKGASV